MQTLVMPFTRQMMLCGYKNANYRRHWKYDHYGVDISTYQGNAGSDHTVYASGAGKVLACGWDNSGGNVIVVQYPEVYNHKTGQSRDLIGRYMHLANIEVRAGQQVSVGDVLGVEGKTQTGDFHLHIEFDTDTKWANYSPQVSSNDDKLTVAQGNILRKGTDTTVNPAFLFHVGREQIVVKPTYNPAWLNPEDNAIPVLPNCDMEEVTVLKARVAELETQLQQSQSVVEDLDRKRKIAISALQD